MEPEQISSLINDEETRDELIKKIEETLTDFVDRNEDELPIYLTTRKKSQLLREIEDYKNYA